MTFSISLTENVTEDRHLERAIIKHRGVLFGKERNEKFGFFRKISYETIFVKRGIAGIFLLFKTIFNRDQYTLEFFLGIGIY